MTAPAPTELLIDCRKEIERQRDKCRTDIDAMPFDLLLARIDTALRQAASVERACICQNEHRRGYCTEPTCPNFIVERAEVSDDIKEIVQGIRDAAAFCDCHTHPDAPQWAGCCRVGARILSGCTEVAGEAVAWRWREISDADLPENWHHQAKEPRFMNPEHFIAEPLGLLASPPRSEGVRGCEVPDYDAAAIALGFARLNTGTWVHPNDDAHFPRRFETAQEIFEKCNPQTMEATRSEVRSEQLDATEQGYLEDNIRTVAFHLGRPGARMQVAIDSEGCLIVDPGEVLGEISRRLSVAQGYEVCGELLFRCAACGTQNSFGPIENAQAIVDCGDDDAIGLANLIEHNCKQREYNLRGTASRMGLIVAALRSYAIPSVPSAQQSTAED